MLTMPPALQMETEEKYFSFIVKTDFSESHSLNQRRLLTGNTNCKVNRPPLEESSIEPSYFSVR